MNAQQIPQLLGTLVIHQRHFTGLSTEDAQWAIKNTEAAIGLCCEAIKNRPQEAEPEVERSAVEPTKLLSVIVTTNLGPVGSKKTVKCFIGSRWAYRDNDFDKWLAKNQSGAEACAVTTLVLSKEWVFIEAVRALPDAPQTNDVIELGNWLIRSGYTLKPQQVEDRVEATERGESTGLRTNSYGNFFFVETGDRTNPVSVGFVNRDGRGWGAFVYRLGDGLHWHAGSRLLVCNLDTSKL